MTFSAGVREKKERLRNAAHLIFVTDYGSKSARRRREGYVVRARGKRQEGGRRL